jgi:hypothetical protein
MILKPVRVALDVCNESDSSLGTGDCTPTGPCPSQAPRRLKSCELRPIVRSIIVTNPGTQLITRSMQKRFLGSADRKECWRSGFEELPAALKFETLWRVLHLPAMLDKSSSPVPPRFRSLRTSCPCPESKNGATGCMATHCITCGIAQAVWRWETSDGSSLVGDKSPRCSSFFAAGLKACNINTSTRTQWLSGWMALRVPHNSQSEIMKFYIRP